MLINYIKTACRNIIRNKYISIINIGGLAFGFAIFLIIIFYTSHKLNHDKFNENYSTIYRLDCGNSCLSPGMVGEWLCNEYPEILSFNRMTVPKELILRYADKIISLDKVLMVDSSFFNMFSYKLIQGNKTSALQLNNTIVINESTARRLFGKEDPVGKSILINNKFNYEITGVMQDMPDNSHIQANALVSIENLKEITKDKDIFLSLGMWNYYTYFLLNKDADISVLENKIDKYFVSNNISDSPKSQLTPLKDIYFKNARAYQYSQGNLSQIKIVLAIGFVILIIAIINYINLSIAQLYNRTKELGVRKVMGAQRRLIFGQLIVESIVFAIIAVNLSIVLIEIMKPFFNMFLNINIRIGYFEQPIRILYFILGGVFIGFIAGIFPALHVSKMRPVVAMKKMITYGKTGIITRKVLIVFQYFIASALVMASFVILLQKEYIQSKDLGFDKDQLIFLKGNDDIRKNREAFRNELLKLANVKEVSYSKSSYRIHFECWSSDLPDNNYICHIEMSDENYLKTLGIELVEGQNFSRNQQKGKRQFLINEAAAKEIFNNKAVGSKIFNGEVVGVVKDYSFQTLHKTIEPLAILYQPRLYALVNIRLEGNNWPKTIEQIERIWEKLSPNAPFQYKFVDDYLNSKYKKEIEFGKLFLLFTVISILIACLGIIGLISFVIQRKTKEIGIRKANGAGFVRIISLLSVDLNKQILIANILAIPVVWVLMNKWLHNFAYHTKIPIWIFIVSFVLVEIISFIAILYQTYKASKLNPVDALRYE